MWRFLAAAILACPPTAGFAAAETSPQVDSPLATVASAAPSWTKAYRAFPTTGWTAGPGHRTDCHLCPDKLFVIVCDANTLGHIRNLRDLAVLQAEYREHPQSWADGKGDAYPCIRDGSFRLGRRAGNRPRSEKDEEAIDIAFQVMQESGDEQIVEVRYGQGTDVVDSFFRYRVSKGRITPLESWVVTRGHVALAMVEIISIVFLLLLLWGGYRGSRRLLRWWRSRRGIADGGFGAS